MTRAIYYLIRDLPKTGIAGPWKITAPPHIIRNLDHAWCRSRGVRKFFGDLRCPPGQIYVQSLSTRPTL